MRCDNCGAQVGPEDRFCEQCGKPVAHADAPQQNTVQPGAAQRGVESGDAMPAAVQPSEVSCRFCGSPVESDMRFCQNCGMALGGDDAGADSAGAGPVRTAPLAVDAVADTAAVPPMNTAANGPQVAGLQSVGSQSDGSQSAGSRPGSHRKAIIAIAIVVAVVAIVAALVACFQLGRRSASNDAGRASASASASQSGTRAQSRSHGDTTSKSKDSDSTVVCDSTPTAEVDSVDHSGSTMIATVRFSASSCDGEFKQRDVRIAFKDGDDTVAAAVFDFSSKPLRFSDGEMTAKLAFSTSQYWRPYDLIDAYTTSVSLRTKTSGEGKGNADSHGAYGGANVDATEIERYAHDALEWQVDHDQLDISRFYDAPTTQLSSKKYGMEVDGKVWKYGDIYAQFLDLRAKWPSAVMLWASDYTYYTRNGHESDFYVVLSGETFDSKDAGKSWCSENHFGANDCMAIQLD